MKYLYLFIGFIIPLAGCRHKTYDQETINNPDGVKKVILAINDQMIAAQGDTSNGAKKYISYCTDSILASSWGDFSMSPYQVAHDLGAGVKIKPHDIRFKLYDKSAILSYAVTSYELFGSDTLYHPLRVTKTFVFDNGKWKMASVANVALPINYTKAVTVQKNSADDLAGIYLWKAGLADTILVKNGKLYSHLTGESTELNFPVNDSEYMVRDDLGRVTFDTNGKGKIIAYTYRNYDGQMIHARKIK